MFSYFDIEKGETAVRGGKKMERVGKRMGGGVKCAFRVGREKKINREQNRTSERL